MIKDWERKLVSKNVHSVFTWCKDCGMRGCNIPFEDECGNCGNKNTVRYYDSETIEMNEQEKATKILFYLLAFTISIFALSVLALLYVYTHPTIHL